MIPSTTVAEHIVQRLADIGVGTLFGVHGANAEDIFDAAVRHHTVTPVIAKHEFGAGAMADGLARITGGPGAVLTTSGGGALNVVPALGESYDSRVPVLALIGSSPRKTVGRGGFQDMMSPPDTIDLPSVMSGVTGFCTVIASPDDVDEAFDRAGECLRRHLPAALIIPKDVQASASVALDRAVTSAASNPLTDPALDALTHRVVDAARSGARVCIWAGEEASRSGSANAIRELAQRLGATVVVSPGGRDVGAADCAGVTGVMGHPSAHAAVADATLLLVVGCRLSLTDRAGLDDVIVATPTVHLGAHPPRVPGVEHVSTTDLAYAVSTLTAAVPHHAEPRTPSGAPREYLSTPTVSAPLSMRDAVTTIGAALPAGCSVFADAGNAGAAAIHYLPFADGRFVVALGMGGMGYGVAAGVGAAIGGSATDAATRTVVIAGDGSFFMHGMEIHTAVEHRAPVTLVVLNNNAHGMCVTRESLYFPTTPGLNRFGCADIAAGLSSMFAGLDVRHATDLPTLRSACVELMTASGPNCLVVDVDPDEVPPFAPFLTEGTL